MLGSKPKASAAYRPLVLDEPTADRPQAATTFLSSDLEAWQGLFPDLGAGVSPDTAMRHSTVYRCVFLIASAIAKAPLLSFRRGEDGFDVELVDHPTARLLKDRPNPRMTPTIFWRLVVSQMLLRGNGIVWIERKRSGEPVALWPIPMARVTISLRNGRLRYQLTLDDGTIVIADQDDVLHFPGSTEWDGLKCKTPIQAMGASVGIGLEADRYARAFFENDATPPSYITYPNQFKNASGQADEIRRVWKDRFGGANRHSGPAVLDQGGEVKQLAITAEDAQLLETRKFQVEDIARLFGVPRPLLAMDDTTWGSGVDSLGLLYLVHTLDPHFVAIAQECGWKLYTPWAIYCAHDPEALTQSDTKGRSEADRVALGGSAGPGYMTPNEVRRRRRLPRSSDPNADKLTGWTPKQQKDTGDAKADPAAGQQ
ncbi:phage portal protein [Caulobacter vibrioides]|uniref:phage portal protein n=1 Tax=Caulobacter vibrioides TaxID=155892 RepID=UPI000BB506D2|nr:phage portal protein [Caulobacter vibrioides]ATC26489.1 phage portal protein [Caulobacter vibrioides]PLR12311.1 phage portal protein [Caulobacter vibrioides]